MVTKKDLRIDNYVFRKDLGDNHLRLEQILALGVKATTSGPIKVICDYKDLEGIPLTKEWFLNLGIEIKTDTFYIKGLKLTLVKEGLIEAGFEDNEFGVNEGDEIYINYVHQLQNLNFALTGTELKIKGYEYEIPTRDTNTYPLRDTTIYIP